MEHLDRLIALRDRGLCTEGLGPELEWHPVSPDLHAQRHNQFWGVLGPMLENAYTDDADADDTTIPFWMSERAVGELTKHDPHN